jgi:heme-degrading monooxygenase HmoA
MFVLHIGLVLKEGMHQSLERTFLDEFRAAISAQEGFSDVQLRRPVDDAANYCLVIAFSVQEQQEKWVATDLHQTVWPSLANNCKDFILSKYNSVS